MKHGVVWISTILYVLISLAIIGMLLAVVQPKIAQIKDSLTIDQTKTILNQIDETILNAKEASGMRLFSELKLGQGQITINSSGNSIVWTYTASYAYSEVNKTIKDIGNIYAFTEKLAGGYKLTFTMKYSTDLTFNGIEQEKVIQAAPSSYKLWFTNNGGKIDITLE